MRYAFMVMMWSLVIGWTSAVPGTEFSHKMFQAIEQGDDQLLRSFLRQGTPANLRSPDGTTLLTYAALHGTPRAVELLLEAGADANAANAAGVTPLIWAAGNPKKVVGLSGYGLEIVEQIPIEIEPNEHNRQYLKTKKEKLGHRLESV